jgi:predicted Zn-dependent protease
MEIAERAKPNPYFGGMARPSEFKKVNTYYDVTSKITPARRAAVVKKICDKATGRNLVASGALSTSVSEIAIVNTKGLVAYQPNTSVSVNIIFSSDDSSGYAQGLSRRFDQIDFGALADRALEKCLLSRNPRTLDPGKYDVILEPTAAANLMEWLSFIAFSANAYHEKTSFLSGKTGKKIAAPSLSIFDDGLNPRGIAFPFDFEGVPKKKVFFIRNGIAGGPVYDLATATRYKVKSTGHGIPPGSTGGPMPLNVCIASGNKPFTKILKSMLRGVLVTRFHYINGFLDTPRAMLTGMTRDGTFLVENGEIVSGIKNLRFTESMSRAFANIQAISKETDLVDTWWGDIGCISAPAIYIKDFNFSGKTEF